MEFLIADDDKLISMSLSAVLGKLGHSVVTVSDGMEAMNKLGQHHFDIALLDIMMPRATGFDILGSQSAKGPNGTKYILMTNLSSPEVYQEAKDKGAAACLKKDAFTPVQLVRYCLDLTEGKAQAVFAPS